MNPTVGITGATGFIGSHTLQRLRELNIKATALTRRPPKNDPQCSWEQWNGTSPPSSSYDIIIHCAAVMKLTNSTQDQQASKFNVEAATHLRNTASTLVHISTASVYRSGHARHNISETYPADNPLSAYAQTKRTAELILQDTAVILRPHAVYGSGERHLLPRLRQAVHGRYLFLPGPDIQLSLTHINTLTDAILHAAGITTGSPWPPDTYNIADPHPYSRDTVAAAILPNTRILHTPKLLLRTISPLSHGLITPYTLDQLTHPLTLNTRKAQTQGWHPQHTFQDWINPNRRLR